MDKFGELDMAVRKSGISESLLSRWFYSHRASRAFTVKGKLAETLSNFTNVLHKYDISDAELKKWFFSRRRKIENKKSEISAECLD